jgi:hypothetical protein
MSHSLLSLRVYPYIYLLCPDTRLYVYEAVTMPWEHIVTSWEHVNMSWMHVTMF